MKALITGFTTKSYEGYVGPGSHGIKDLTTAMPEILGDLDVDVHYANDKIPVTDFDIVFIKIWNINDARYASHVPALIDYLIEVDMKKVVLISDHWNCEPAYKSMIESKKLFLHELCQLRGTNRELTNVYRPQRDNEIDPSIYFDVRAQLSFQSPRWIYGSLSDNKMPPESLFNYPVDYYSDLTEQELCQKIVRHGLVYANEYANADPRWWRIRYYMAAQNGAAVYASERDQKAIYGFFIPANIIEKYRSDVFMLQSSALLDAIEPKSSIHRKVLKLLRK